MEVMFLLAADGSKPLQSGSGFPPTFALNCLLPTYVSSQIPIVIFGLVSGGGGLGVVVPPGVAGTAVPEVNAAGFLAGLVIKRVVLVYGFDGDGYQSVILRTDIFG